MQQLSSLWSDAWLAWPCLAWRRSWRVNGGLQQDSSVDEQADSAKWQKRERRGQEKGRGTGTHNGALCGLLLLAATALQFDARKQQNGDRHVIRLCTLHRTHRNPTLRSNPAADASRKHAPLNSDAPASVSIEWQPSQASGSASIDCLSCRCHLVISMVHSLSWDEESACRLSTVHTLPISSPLHPALQRHTEWKGRVVGTQMQTNGASDGMQLARRRSWSGARYSQSHDHWPDTAT